MKENEPENAIVAGAGIWGCTMARRLAEAGRKVLVLEPLAKPSDNESAVGKRHSCRFSKDDPALSSPRTGQWTARPYSSDRSVASPLLLSLPLKASERANKGFASASLEKRPVVGGNVRCEIDPETGIEIHKYGSHIFHTHNPDVWDFVNCFVSFNGYQHNVLAWTRATPASGEGLKVNGG